MSLFNWLIYSGGTDRPGELCYNFSIYNDLTQMVNFPTQKVNFPTVTHKALLYWIHFFLLM